MSRCEVTSKRPLSGNNVSAHNKTRRRFLPNLQSHKFWVESENKWIRLRVSTKGLRIIDKNGIDAVLKDLRSKEKYRSTYSCRKNQTSFQCRYGSLLHYDEKQTNTS